MADFKAVHERAEIETQEEQPVLTRLVSSEGLATSNIEAWQLNQFECFDLNEAEKVPDISEEIYREVKQRIEPELRQQAEVLKKEAYDLAYQKGYQEGFSKGSDKGESEAKKLALQASDEALSDKIMQIDALLSMLKQPYEQLENQVLSELTELALHVAYQVTQKEVLEDRNWVLEAIQEAIRALPDNNEAFFIEVSTEDFGVLQSLNHPMQKQWDLKVNASLEQGICVVKQGNSSVLNSWKSRFDEVSSQILTRASSGLS